jgi:hypothetical protein
MTLSRTSPDIMHRPPVAFKNQRNSRFDQYVSGAVWSDYPPADDPLFDLFFLFCFDENLKGMDTLYRKKPPKKAYSFSNNQIGVADGVENKDEKRAVLLANYCSFLSPPLSLSFFHYLLFARGDE